MNNPKTHETYPLSPLQEGMLFHSLAAIGSGVDIEQIICTVHEPLDKEAFQRAWSRVVDRHPVLRSQFEWEGTETGEPFQVVMPAVSFMGEYFDWKHLSASEQNEKRELYFVKDRTQGFDLGRAPLMRLAVFELGDNAYTFIWTFHHILLDGRAFPLLLEEVFTLYEAFVEQRDSALDQSRPFREYISWVRERDLAKDEKYWRETLSGFTSPTPLVVGSTPTAGKMSLGSEGSVAFRIPAALTSALRQLASSRGLTMNTLVEGAWALLLSRYSGEEDVVYGTTRSCRRDSVDGADDMIGLLINTVPMRVKVPGEATLIDWLKQLRGQHTRMRGYIHAPLSDIQKWSEITHGNPLFESLVVFENYLLGSYMRSKGGRWAHREVEYRGRTNFPLHLSGYNDDELLLRIEFDEGRFELDTIKRMSGHLRTILLGIPENLDTPVAMLPILSDAERHQLLVEWNDTGTDYPQDTFIHELFEAQAAANPEAIAVVHEGRALSYQELNSRANKLAHYLGSLGVKPDSPVAICVERSPEMVVGILAILKAGGAYVPVDPTYPADRLGYMLADSSPLAILTHGRVAESVRSSISATGSGMPPVIDLNADAGCWTGEPDSNPDLSRIGLTPSHLAYIIYTSGSTGKPKGVMVEHRGVSNLLNWYLRDINLTGTDAVLLVTSHSFDLTQKNILGPLVAGGQLHLASEPFDPRMYLNHLEREQITLINLTPSAFHALIEANTDNQINSTCRVVLGGEPVQAAKLLLLPEPRPEVINHYGPTECSDVVACHHLSPHLELYLSGSVPLGSPVPNNRLYLLDTNRQPVPIGIPGELCVGGIQVARGYLNRPGLTAEKFMPDPFSDVPGARLYHTGDLARYLPGGAIEYLGRTDHQVKIRGFRIELGEIETALEEHDTVGQVVVMAREDVPGDKRLVAYIVPEVEQTPSAGVLRQYLKETLPEYMVPNAFVTLEKFPLTPNGKIDRRALPVPEADRQAEAGYIPPRNEVEELIAGIWQELLNVKNIGVNDSFFEVGGHSLLAIRAISQINRALQADLQLRSFFENPTIAELSQSIESGRNIATAATGSRIVPISRESRRSRQ